MKKYRLMSPGPTPVPERVLLKMADTIIHHRTPRFQAVLRDVTAKLKKVFRTENPVLVFASSGTGAMEASVVNLLSKGDKALVINGGKFGERFGDICRTYGVETVMYDVAWGEAADPEKVAALLKQNPAVKVVYSTLCETSTGVLNDIRTIAAKVRATDAVLVVDAISGLAADELAADEWGVDVVVSGSQKGLMVPPGLSFLSLSKKALKLVENSALPKFYFDIKAALKAHSKDDTPWTPAISLITGLNEALDMLIAEGIENTAARHARLAKAAREAVEAIGLEVYARRPSNALTAVKVPSGIDGSMLVKKMQDEQSVTIAGGQGEMKGKLFRIAHLGYMDEYDLVSTMAALEIVLNQLGYKVPFGKGTGRVAELLS